MAVSAVAGMPASPGAQPEPAEWHATGGPALGGVIVAGGAVVTGGAAAGGGVRRLSRGISTRGGAGLALGGRIPGVTSGS